VTADSGAPDAITDALPGCSALSLPAKAYAAQYQIGIALEPGEEHEVCAIHAVGPKEIHLNSSEVKMSLGSHHGLLWQTSYTELPEKDRKGNPIELDKVVSCESAANSLFDVTGIVAGSQGLSNVTADGVLPSNVALTLPANSYVVSNLHLVNVSDNPRDACMKVGLRGLPAGEVEHEAAALFFYDPFIAIEQGESSSARMACPITQQIQLKSGTSHMHKRGVNYHANLLSGNPYDKDTKVVTELYKTTQWDAPPDRIWDEPLTIEEGQWIDYQCDYENDGDRDVAQGLETTDEMCMFLGMYWPKNQALSFCQDPMVKSGGASSGGYQIGSGKLDGSAFLACMLTSDFSGGATEGTCGYGECKNYAARFKFQSCFVEACEAVGRYTRPYLNCFSAHSKECSTECEGQSSSCTLTCLNTNHCKAEADALTAAKCN
jgi:hypothetical protein